MNVVFDRYKRKPIMHSVTGTVESIVSSARRLVRLDRSADTRREAFSQEFGTYPPYQEASTSDREQFELEMVRPVLAQRAQAVQQAVQDREQHPAAQTKREADEEFARGHQRTADEAFARAYQVAVDMGLAKRGLTYRDYLGHQE